METAGNGANNGTVLVVDDEPEIAELMRDFLEADGFTVVTAGDAIEARSVLDRTPVDVALLDVMMPGRSGFDLLREIREAGDLPVLLLSARDGDVDKIRGLGLGADDYVVKSATPAEVVARIKAVLRRAQRSATPHVLDFGRLSTPR
ncbi:MAG: response regulator [Chloroflexota bacterium]|nr:response regulator [Chloroflexota bacterium]